MGVPTYMYSAECPQGRVFDSEQIPAGWVDAPGKIKTPKRKRVTPQRSANGDA